MQTQKFDAIVVGARVAGAATAMQLARGGARVLLVDREPEIKDTLSTHALMRPAIHLLAHWGLMGPIKASTPAVLSTQFVYGDEVFDIPLKPDAGYEGLFAPRRWLLDRVLGDAAQEAGVELRTATICCDVIRRPDKRVSGVVLMDRESNRYQITADLIVGADGRNSTIAKLVGAKENARSDIRSACAYTYVEGIPNSGYRWFYDANAAAGLIPTSNNQHCLFVACPSNAFKARFGTDINASIREQLRRWDTELAERLDHSSFVEKPKKFLGAPGHMRQCAGAGWALVGDAGYFKDPLTAHGITDALRDAHILTEAAMTKGLGELTGYQIIRDQLSAKLFQITEEIASFDWSLDQLKALHMHLNTEMKAEFLHLQASLNPSAQAA
ncbi:NAD(P)/FAD-dependent oxidoreductase [Ruegeria sp. 2205SS24-7]|uniref:NAD(P)/FAD-dependent oxidoreductase n=1 Tax=Ruegeria discodermiae TaxID=3064389 RepID=UPI0027410EE4|nr:NAD(P)/FAD-dependent oxidoreductase [Ruegeria sp. 2205SS24-7]MDP5220991.1 NAD(P)/FAD-dependent oxidoreductase [Ruegeria sp. 2205SS24-7]